MVGNVSTIWPAEVVKIVLVPSVVGITEDVVEADGTEVVKISDSVVD